MHGFQLSRVAGSVDMEPGFSGNKPWLIPRAINGTVIARDLGFRAWAEALPQIEIEANVGTYSFEGRGMRNAPGEFGHERCIRA